jgi:hypothetical protein
LVQIAEPGIGSVAGRARAVSMACGDPAADPYSRCRSGQRVGSGAAIWKSVAGYFAAAHARADRERARMRSGHSFIFERLGHVAINLQSFSVCAGKVVCFCSPNGQ